MVRPIDTHAHLYSAKFDADRPAVMARAQAMLQAVLLPNIDEASLQPMAALADDYPGFAYPMVGLHPCHVDPARLDDQLAAMDAAFRTIPNVVAVGETGTDRYWDPDALPPQLESLRAHLAWAKARQLPLVLHCRNSLDETLDMLERELPTGVTGVFHCFEGTYTQAKRALDLGFYLGFGGTTTYKKNAELRAVAAHADPSRWVLETDCPYLAPTPHRGKRNESAYVVHVAEALANETGEDLPTLVARTNANARRLFGLPQPA